MPISNPKEEIDSRILRLIGLEDVFDLDYETYLTLLKEAMVKSRMTKKTIPTEEVMLLTDEFKRVKSKKDNGRFEVKKKKITAKSFAVGGIKGQIAGKTTKALPGTSISTSPLSRGLEDNITAITGSLVSIAETLKQQKKVSDDESAYGKRKAEQEKRGLTESKLEKRFEGLKKAAEKIIAPVKSLLDKIIQFFTTVILGRIVYKLVEWLGDPNNASKVKSIIRFVKDWWPALLGSYILFGTSFGKLIRGLTGTVGRFIFQLGRVAIPGLLKLIARNPLATLIVGTSVAGTVARTSEREKLKPEVEKQRASIENTQKDSSAPWYKKLGSAFAGQQLSMGQGQAIVAPVPGAMYNGGGLASGFVSGEKGIDKVPAMLSDGEFVMSRGAVAKYGVDTLEAMNAAGGGTNKPKVMGGTTYAAGGGRIGKDPVRDFIKYKLGYDVDRPETWGASFGAGISGMSGSSGYRMSAPNLSGILNQQNIVNYGQRKLNDITSSAPKILSGAKNKGLNVIDSPLAALEKYGTERENALIKSGELKPGAALTKTAQANLNKSDAWIKSLYDPEKDKGTMGFAKKVFQDVQNKGLISDPFAMLGLKEEGTEKFVEKISGGRVKNLGAKITGLQYALKGLAGPLGKAFRIDDRGSLGRYVKPAILEAQRRGQGGVGAVGLGQEKYNELMGDKLANLALGQFNFKVDKKGRATTDDTYEGNKPASEYFKGARSSLKKGDIGGALFKGVSGILRINQNTGWGNLRPGGIGIDLGGGFTPTDDKGKPIPPTKAKSPVTMYGPNDPRRKNTGESYKSRFARPKNAGIKPVKPPSKPVPKVIKTSPQGGSRGSGSKPSTSRPPSFSASTRGMRSKQETLGLMR